MTSKITSRTSLGSERFGASVRPSIDAARTRLGGRVSGVSRRAPGSLVMARLRDGTRRPGVVLWASETHCDVWFADGLARRTRAESVRSYYGHVSDHLGRVAVEMRIFATLSEGQLVRWERAVAAGEGCIVEKCRYGAIVVTRDGKLVAVGFRKLWPAVIAGGVA
jgi:hypothetical protein